MIENASFAETSIVKGADGEVVESNENGEHDDGDDDAMLGLLTSPSIVGPTSSIHQLAWTGMFDSFCTIVEKFPGAKDAVDESEWGEGFRPIHYAAYQGHLDIVKYLIDKTALLDARTKSGCTALFYASQQSRPKCVKALLDARVRIDIESTDMKLLPVDVASNKEILDLFRSKYGKHEPETPRAPHIVGVGVDFLVVTWKPSDATDSPRPGTVSRYDLSVVGRPRRSGKHESSEREILQTQRVVRNAPRLRVRVIGLPRSYDGTIVCRIKAHSVLGSSAWSKDSQPICLVRPPNRAPSGLRAAEGGIHRRSVVLQWESISRENDQSVSSKAAEITGYVVEKRIAEHPSTHEEFSWEIGARTDSDVCEAEIKRLWMDTEYEFRVAAVNGAGTGTRSKCMKQKTPALEVVKATKRVGRALKAAKIIASTARSRLAAKAATAAMPPHESKSKKDDETSETTTRPPLADSDKREKPTDTGGGNEEKIERADKSKFRSRFRWSFSETMCKHHTDTPEPTHALVSAVFEAGDEDGDGYWNFKEYNRINEKMESGPINATQFEFLCKKIGDDPLKGLSVRYLNFLHSKHEKKFIGLFHETAQALGIQHTDHGDVSSPSKPRRSSSFGS